MLGFLRNIHCNFDGDDSIIFGQNYFISRHNKNIRNSDQRHLKTFATTTIIYYLIKLPGDEEKRYIIKCLY